MDRAALAGSMVRTRPAVPPARLVELLREHWAVDAGSLVDLPSERDQNARVDLGDPPIPRWVLKVANPAEDPAFLDAQEVVLDRLVAAGLPVARSIPPRAGGPVFEPTPDGPARVRLLTWLEGRRLATLTRARPPDLARAIGELVGRVTVALEGLAHPGADRPFQWDLRRAVETVGRGLPHVADPERRALLGRRLDRLRELAPRVDGLRRSIVHNDANDHNLLVDDDGRVSGLLDLGDMVHSATVGELAVAQTYAMLDQPDPLTIAADVAAGFDAHVARTREERALEAELILARLSISVAISAAQAALDPDPYLRISEAPAWRLLDRLERGGGSPR